MKRAFTLIELLVVIAIIALLSSVILSSLNAARAKSYDAKRVSDLREVQKALETYYSTNGNYPATSGSWHSECNGYSSSGVVSGLVPTYISQFPSDPQMKNTGSLNPSSSCCYAYTSDGSNYDVLDYNCSTSNTSNPALSSFKDPYNTSMWSVRSSDAAALANQW